MEKFQPRLGPKPFTSGSALEFSFDKVFSVPQVPGTHDTNGKNDNHEDQKENIEAPVNGKHANGHSHVHEKEKELEPEEPQVTIREQSTRLADDEKPKVLSTTERRKVMLYFHLFSHYFIHIFNN